MPALLVKPVNQPTEFPEIFVPFTGGSTKELGQNVLNSLNLVKDVPQSCEGEREVINQRNIQEINKVV